MNGGSRSPAAVLRFAARRTWAGFWLPVAVLRPALAHGPLCRRYVILGAAQLVVTVGVTALILDASDVDDLSSALRLLGEAYATYLVVQACVTTVARDYNEALSHDLAVAAGVPPDGPAPAPGFRLDVADAFRRLRQKIRNGWAGVEFDLLFGPAYKGIPLATALACELARRGRDVPLAFNRKEAKAHGEGGLLIGAPLAGRRVLIVDDVITAGTAIGEALAMIAAAGGTASGIVVALDRQERVREDAGESAAQAVAAEHGVPVVAVATLDDLLAFAGKSRDLVRHQDALHAYRARYGTA